MTAPFQKVQPALAFAAAHLDEDVSLNALAAQAGLSVFHLHRIFRAAAGETPKNFTLRLRLGRAAVLLLTGGDSVLNVALSCGFQSHEVFCRAFRRRFGMAPTTYRARGFAAEAGPVQAQRHAALVSRSAPCIGLYRLNLDGNTERIDVAYSITKKVLNPQPVLVMRRRLKRSEIAATLGEVFGRVFQYAQKEGIALAGPPFARYLEMGPGLMTMEAGLPVAASVPVTHDSEIISEMLPGSLVAATTHVGPYDKLHEAFSAMDEWIEAQGLKKEGAPWESYVTDPADYPDPKDWKTEVYWPVSG